MRRKQEHVTKVKFQEVVLQMPLPWSRGNKKYKCQCLQSLKRVQSKPVYLDTKKGLNKLIIIKIMIIFEHV